MRALLDVVDDVFPIEEADVLRAAAILQTEQRLSSRDALHVAIMERHGISKILSFDADYDTWPGIDRLFRA